MSPRTVVNWEREGGQVPERSEIQVASVLRLTRKVDGDWEVNSLNDLGEEIRKLGADKVRMNSTAGDPAVEILRSAMQRSHVSFQENEEHAAILASVLEQATGVIDFAELASRAGAHPETVLKLIEAVAAVGFETGIGLISGGPAETFSQEVIARGASVGSVAAAAFQPTAGHRAFPFRLNDAHAVISAKPASVSGVEENAESGDDVEIPENVEEVWGLAAHPKTDAPEDHTP